MNISKKNIYICTDDVEGENILKNIILELDQMPCNNREYSSFSKSDNNFFKNEILKADIIVLLISSQNSYLGSHNFIKEYNFARLLLKPIIILIRSNIEKLPPIKRVINKRHLIEFWNNYQDLEKKFLVSLFHIANKNEKTIHTQKNKNNYDDLDIYQEKLENIFGLYQTNQNNDIIGLMINNLSEIRQFYILTKEQAQNAYILAKRSCIAGICIIIFAIIMGTLPNRDNTVAIVTTISGVIIEVFAGTSLFVYQKTLKQLNYYYASLHNNERFLSLINIASKTNVSDELYSKIVESELDNLKQYEIKNDNTQ